MTFGWRRRIGYIAPGAFQEAVYDFYRIAPDGVGLVGVGAVIKSWSKDEYAHNLEKLDEAAAYLAKWNVHMVIHAGAPMIATQGHAFMKDLMSRLSEHSGGLPSSTALYSAMEAIRSFDAASVVVVTPFPRETHDAVVQFVKEAGFEVVHEETLADAGYYADAGEFFKLHEIGLRQAYDYIIGALKKGADAGAEVGYVPCPQWHAFEMVHELEGDADMPVVTSNGGDYWYAFRTLGIHDVAPGHGVLFDRLRQSRVR